MYNVIHFLEHNTNGYETVIIDVFTIISIICAILVIISKNPILSVLFLIGLFLSIACYLLALGISFIGISYLMVYVGAVSILFLFILMLINVRVSELLGNTSNSIALGIFISISYYSSVYPRLANSIASSGLNLWNNLWLTPSSDTLNISFKVSNPEQDNGKIYYVTSQIWDGNMAETSHIVSIGNIMYTSYSIWLILTSIILLLAMIGALVVVVKSPVPQVDALS